MPHASARSHKNRKKASLTATAKKPQRARTKLIGYGRSHKNLQHVIQHLSIPEVLELFCQTIEYNPVAVLITNAQGKIKYLNHRFAQLTGCALDKVLGKNLKDLITQYGAAEIYHQFCLTLASGESQKGEFQAANKQGELFWESILSVPIKNNRQRITHVVSFSRDISSHKQSERLIKHMIEYDQLTDLPNRSLFTGRLARALEQARAAGQRLAVAILGLDRFKVINDTLGHSVGDQLLQSVAKRLQICLRAKDTVARMGGDEFIILLPPTSNFLEALKSVQNIMDQFMQPFICDGHELRINASMGISLFPEDGDDPLTLLKNADTALYEAKSSGRNHYKFFTVKLNTRALEQLHMENALKQALENNQFCVYYQPQVNFKNGQIESFEALVRWQHPQQGLLSPDRFITLAEETGLIVPIGEWVLRTACAQTMEWQQKGFGHLRIAVNLSARQFSESELVEKVLGICHETGLEPRFLQLEITESILLEDLNITSMILQWLTKKGITMAIDDFGTGYSSLQYLKRFPIHTLKIDRGFVRECLNSTDDAAIVATITSIARNLHLQVIAEGVETREQLHFMQNLGCHAFQGYLFSPPIPPGECLDLLKKYHLQGFSCGT